MAFDPTATTIDGFHVLCEISLTGKTLRFADDHLSMSDNNFYDGRLKSGEVRAKFASLLESKQKIEDFNITLDNRDLGLDNDVAGYEWGNKAVVVKVGFGRDLTNYDTVWQGLTRYPKTMSHGDREIKLRCVSNMSRDYRTLPINKLWVSNYPNLESGLEGTPIPIVYGNFDSTHTCPAYCIDTAFGGATKKQFIIADHQINDITQVYVDGLPIAHGDEDLANAKFSLTNAQYTENVNVCTVDVEGTEEGAGIMENPGDILEDLLTTWCGAAGGDLDAAVFASLVTDTADLTLRRWIGVETSANILVGEILLECGIDMSMRSGKYYPVLFVPDIDAASDEFTDLDIVQGSFSATYDPENVTCNRLKGKFGLNPSGGEYTDEDMVENVDNQTAVGQVVSRTIYYEWLYDTTEVAAVIARHMMRVGNSPEVITLELKHRAALKNLGDQIKLTYGRFSSEYVQIREIVRNFTKLRYKVSLWALATGFGIGAWTSDAAPNEGAATPAELAALGFWQANAEPSPSDVSNWW